MIAVRDEKSDDNEAGQKKNCLRTLTLGGTTAGAYFAFILRLPYNQRDIRSPLLEFSQDAFQESGEGSR